MTLSKISNVKTMEDLGDLENKIKVKIMTGIKGLVIMHLWCKYHVCTSQISEMVIMEKMNFDPKNPDRRM